MIAEIIAVIGLLIENCTGVIIVEKVPLRTREEVEEAPLIQAEQRHRLQDFTKFDANDAIFREYDPPENEEEDPKAWKKSRPSIKSSIWKCFKFVFFIQTVSGTALGFLVIFIAFLDFNSADLCYDQTANWNKMPDVIASIRVAGQAVEGFIIELWNYLLLSTVFPWSVMKELNLLTLNLLAAFTDMTYRLVFQLFGIYKIWWMSYPLNALFTSMSIINSFILARHFKPRPISWKIVSVLAFSFSAQFVLGMSANIFLVYKLLPWYNEQVESTKVVVAACCPLLTALPKVVSRLAAQNLEDVHPGTAHVFVGLLYGSTAIVFRIMQAELTSFELFVALGVGHAIVDLLERLTITMRDSIWEYLYKRMRCLRRPTQKYRSPRSRRFIADVSIQIMLQEATGLVAALGFITLYHFMYSDEKPSYSDYKVLLDFLIRALTGLTIDLFFNSLSVVIQTHYMNVAVTRVWSKKWRYHLVVNTIMSSLTIIYFTEYLFGVVRNKYDYSKHKAVRFAWNCSMPFEGL
jgi:hypothetical protein